MTKPLSRRAVLRGLLAGGGVCLALPWLEAMQASAGHGHKPTWRFGGGPVGVALAVNLGMRGISCAVIERRAKPSPLEWLRFAVIKHAPKMVGLLGEVRTTPIRDSFSLSLFFLLS